MKRIEIPDNWLGEPIKGAMEQVLREEKPEDSSADVSIQSGGDFWSVDGVQYRDGIYRVDLAKTLLDNGTARTQADWAEYSKDAQKRNEFYTPDYPLFYGLVKALHSAKDESLRNQEVEDARTFLRDSSRQNWLVTLTRISYQPSGKDRVIHNFGMNDMYEEQTEFVGQDGEIISLNDSLAYNSLLGTKDSPQKISEVIGWLNETPVYLWRVNSKPKKIEERVARFVAYSGRADLDCYGGPAYASSSLGVRAVRRGAASAAHDAQNSGGKP